MSSQNNSVRPEILAEMHTIQEEINQIKKKMIEDVRNEISDLKDMISEIDNEEEIDSKKTDSKG